MGGTDDDDEDDDDVATGELSGTGHDGCSGVGQSGLCQAADRERRQHPSLSDYSTSGGAVQHGETHLSTTETHRCGVTNMH